MAGAASERVGALLVFLSALAWSFGGAIARFLETDDSWTMVFWRSFWAAAFLIGFMVWRDGWRGMIALFRGMGGPGLAVAACFATASISFVVALGFTTVANVILISASVPLLAALFGWIAFRERVSRATWTAIAAVIVGVAVMVSDSIGGTVSPIGDGLALMIAISFATATVISRRYAHVRMTPAMCGGAIMAAALAATQAGSLIAGPADMAFLFAFGALNLGLGAALFTSGVRLIPAAYAALLGTFEPMLAPLWVWLIHGEVPSLRTVIGGGIILVALLSHIFIQLQRTRRILRPAEIGIPSAH
jgi:drug/metabolite transporter (DMT)-like permease